MSPGEWEALLAASLDEAEPPGDDEEDLDPEGCVLPWDEDLAAIEPETGRVAAERGADAQYLAQAETAELAGITPHEVGADHPAGPHRTPGPGPGPGGIPAGFAGRNHLTIPLATLLGLADRPGELHGLGPVDPWLARDLATASAASPATTWCLTVTDSQGRVAGHACARPEPRHPTRRRKRGPPGGTSPPRTTSTGFTLTPIGPGPPGGYGSWRFTTGIPGQRAWIITIDPIPAGDCDHRYQAPGHDPGVKLRHLTQIRHATCTAPTCQRPPSRLRAQHPVRDRRPHLPV